MRNLRKGSPTFVHKIAESKCFALTYIKYNPGPEKHSIVGLWLPK